jgi:hypothetical protein
MKGDLVRLMKGCIRFRFKDLSWTQMMLWSVRVKKKK